jgi:hypothetical protein
VHNQNEIGRTDISSVSSVSEPPHVFVAMIRFQDEDPLARAIAPPLNESPADKLARELAESEASRISEEIDNRIRQEKAALKKKKKAVKVLLLGQSESGASCDAP